MKRAAWWSAPGALFLLLYWPGLWTWFMQDDFAWLGLNLRLAEGHSLWPLLFQPSQHGTLRPLSERAFFLGFYQMFGLDAFPFRVWIYATQLANLVLLAWIVKRLTGSRHAGFWAPVFWMVNTAVAGTLSWTCAYNQILCGFFILLALYFLIRYVETSQWRYYLLQWVTFLLGFGALELNLVYPLVAAAFCLCCAQRYLRSTIPMFVVSGAFVAVNQLLIPKAAQGPYSLHFDAALPLTLSKYWIWSFGGMGLERLFRDPDWNRIGLAAGYLLTAALLGFAAWKLRNREWLAGFFLLWFPLVVSPVVPLRDHFTDYYLTLPTMGIAMLGGWAFAVAWQQRLPWRITTILLAALYLVPSVAVTREVVVWNFERSASVRNFVLGVGRAQELHPGKIILLDGLPPTIFWSAMRDKPFPLVGASRVYLTPEAEKVIPPHPELAEISEFVLPMGPILKALAAGDAVVYDAAGPALRNITTLYGARARSLWKGEPARRVDVGNPLFEEQVDKGWYPIEFGYRWMKKDAVVRLGGPRAKNEKLYITGFSSAEQLRQGPVQLTVSIEDSQIGRIELNRGDAQFDAGFALPGSLVGKTEVLVRLSVDRTFISAAGGRELGAAFGVVAIR